MTTLQIQTHKKDEVIDITELIEKQLSQTAIATGICSIFVAHTTCSVTTADLDPGTDLDLLDGLRNMLPKLSYRHPHDPLHTPDHILSSIIGPSVHIPFQKKQLLLGTWQRIILVELDGPRTRTIYVSLLKEN